MSKYKEKCGPNAIDEFNDYSNSYRKHVVSGTGIIEKCHVTDINSYKDSYTICEGITEVGDKCFNKQQIESVKLPSTIEIIGDECFKKSRITYISLPESLKKIGHNNFPDTLTSLTIPPSIEEFHVDNVWDCTKLERIEVSIESKHYKSLDGILYNYEMTEILCCPRAKKGHVRIPNTVKSVGHHCFFGCQSLSSITIPNSVVKIDNGAFQCMVIDSLFIRNTVISIGKECFSRTNIKKEFRFPQNFKHIPDYTFYDSSCTIKQGSFFNVETIGKNAFASLSSYYNFKYVSLPSIISLYVVKEIGEEAFRYCRYIKLIELFSSLNKIGRNAFSGTNNLIYRYYSYTPLKIDSHAFDEIGDSAILVIPKGTRQIFESCEPWSFFPNIEEWDVNVDREDDKDVQVTDEIYSKRLKSIAASKLNPDRVYLKDIISELALNYQYIESDRDFDDAMELIQYNRSFSPAIIPDLEQTMCQEWSNKFKLKLLDEAILYTPASPLLITPLSQSVSLPKQDILSLPINEVEVTAQPMEGTAKVDVYFNDQILKQVQNQLAMAKKRVCIAVSWFTNYALFKQLKVMAEEGIKVELIINNDLTNNGGYCLNFNKLIEAGADICLIEYPHLLHHKFCLIDDTTIINGSYNWTRFSAKNYENIVVVTGDDEAFSRFETEFKQLQENAEHKHILQMPDAVPERPEYDRSAFRQYITEELDAQAREISDERNKITALHAASKFNPDYFDKINPEAKKHYAEAFKVVDDAKAMQDIVLDTVKESIQSQTAATNTTNESLGSKIESSSKETTAKLKQTKTDSHPRTTNSLEGGNANSAMAYSGTGSRNITAEETEALAILQASSLVMVLDVSGSMQSTYQNGHVHNITMKALAASLAIAESNEVALWKFGNNASFVGNIGMENISDIQKVKCERQGTNLQTFVTNANSSIQKNALVIIFTDDDSDSIQKAISGMKERSDVFWQIIVYGSQHDSISSAIQNVDNTSVVNMEDYDKMDAKKIKTLVVDAQYNGGGSSRLCNALLQHLYPIGELENYTTYLRFSNLMAAYNPKIAAVKARWEEDGHKDELYEMPSPKIPAEYQQPAVYEGNVIFVMGPKTYSSAGILLTLARDNHIGTIIGTTSTFSPSHYGEVLPYRLPNTGGLGSISCKFFARPDAANVDAACMEPDCVINLDDKEQAWQYIIKNYSNY